MQKSSKVGLLISLELPSFPHAVLYNQTIVGPRHAGAIEDPSSPSASLLPLYDPEVTTSMPLVTRSACLIAMTRLDHFQIMTFGGGNFY